MYVLNPTLFINTAIAKIGLYQGQSIESSIEFLDCADSKLTQLFNRITGLKPGKNLCFSISNHFIGQSLIEPGETSKLNINLYVNHNWNPVTVLWKSKSGRIYKIDDIDIDCNDIEFWFDKLDTELYISSFIPAIKNCLS